MDATSERDPTSPGPTPAAWRGKTPQVAMPGAETTGYRPAILPGMLTMTIHGACDRTGGVRKDAP
jgi:hypothetical protein